MPGVMPGEYFPLVFNQKIVRVREKGNMPPRISQFVVNLFDLYETKLDLDGHPISA